MSIINELNRKPGIRTLIIAQQQVTDKFTAKLISRTFLWFSPSLLNLHLIVLMLFNMCFPITSPSLLHLQLNLFNSAGTALPCNPCLHKLFITKKWSTWVEEDSLWSFFIYTYDFYQAMERKGWEGFCGRPFFTHVIFFCLWVECMSWMSFLEVLVGVSLFTLVILT